MKQSKKFFNAVGILAIGAILTGGGLFLWQNQFNVIFAPKASADRIQAIVEVGEQSNNDITYGHLVAKELNKSLVSHIEVVTYSEVLGTTALRDQAVLGYNSLTKPIEDHVYFFVTFGQKAVITALQNQESKQVITSKVSASLSELVDLAASRPGVFPSGFTVFIAPFPNPVTKSGNITACGGVFSKTTNPLYQETYSAMSAAIQNMATLYPQYVKVVDTSNFSEHSLESKDPWFSSCTLLNSKGESALAEHFLTAVGNNR